MERHVPNLNQSEIDKVLLDMQEHKDGIYGMIKDGYFETHNMPVKPIKPKLKPGHTSIQALDYGNALAYYEQEIAAYEREIKIYRDKAVTLHEMFKFAVMWDYSLDGLKKPVYDKTFALAWDRGHSAGLYEVYNCLADLADLMILTIEKEN